jgi:hypothetical protein
MRILRSLDNTRDLWRKWPPARDTLIRKAADCWVPVKDVHAAENVAGTELVAILELMTDWMGEEIDVDRSGGMPADGCRRRRPDGPRPSPGVSAASRVRGAPRDRLTRERVPSWAE